MDDTFARILGAIGTVTGLGSLAVSFLAYQRDRPLLVVRILRDRRIVGPGLDELFELHEELKSRYGDDVAGMPPGLQALNPKKEWAYVEIANAGRRPVYFNRALLILENGQLLFVADSKGTKIEEGDKPVELPVDEELLREQERSDNSPVLCAVAIDTLNRTYYSPVGRGKTHLLRAVKRRIAKRLKAVEPSSAFDSVAPAERPTQKK